MLGISPIRALTCGLDAVGCSAPPNPATPRHDDHRHDLCERQLRLYSFFAHR